MGTMMKPMKNDLGSQRSEMHYFSFGRLQRSRAALFIYDQKSETNQTFFVTFTVKKHRFPSTKMTFSVSPAGVGTERPDPDGLAGVRVV